MKCSLAYIIIILATTMSVAAGGEVMSLDSFDGTFWQVFPADGLKWQAVAKGEYEPEDWVAGVVPGTVFVAYIGLFPKRLL